MKHAIAIDLGGTAIKGAIIDAQGKITSRHKVLTESDLGKEHVIQNLFSVIETLQDGSDGNDFVGIGVAAAGPTNAKEGIVLQFPNITIENNFPIGDLIKDKFALPVVVHNDANAAMLGEVWQGAAKGAHSAVLLTLGTGIGGGIVIHDKIFDGAYGVGAELGHVRLCPDGPQCSLGMPGCFEALASASAVVRMARETIDSAITDSKEVYDLAKNGNPDALVVWKDVGKWLGMAVGNFINEYNPEFCLIGGNMADAWEFFAPTMMQEAQQNGFAQLFDMVTIQQAALGNDAGMFGVAKTVFDL